MEFYILGGICWPVWSNSFHVQNFRLSSVIEIEKKHTKIKFLNNNGATNRNHLKSSFTTKQQCINFYNSTQWESFDQLSRMKM